MAQPTTAPPDPNVAPWDDAVHWLTSAGHQVVHWASWPLSVEHLAEVAVIGAPLVSLVTVLRIWHVFRLLERRRRWAVIPTERYTRRLSDNLVTNVGKIMSQVRRRAAFLRWWMRPASSIRFRLDTITRGGMIYSIDGPRWAREVIETTGYTGIILCPMDALDLSQLTPKGIYVPPEGTHEPGDDTQPGAWRQPVGR
ncbi:MAG TPA: hypothetical protein VFA45_05995 [Actinomycetes bacterium]|nr:hypothetical protein [Actinomycetes bacterium]